MRLPHDRSLLFFVPNPERANSDFLFAAMEERAEYKSKKLYDVLDQSHKFVAPVEKTCRSRMTAVFRAKGANAAQVEEAFIQKAAERGMEQLRGHRSVRVASPKRTFACRLRRILVVN